MQAPALTLANDMHRETSMVRKNFERERGLNGKPSFGHENSNLPEIYTDASRNETRNFILSFKRLRLNLQKVHIHVHNGCVSVSFAQRNEEINVILRLQRCCQQFEKPRNLI